MIIPVHDIFLYRLFNMTFQLDSFDDNYNIAVDICEHVDEDYRELDQKYKKKTHK